MCPYLWMRMVYRGWRGYHHLTVVPWTSLPVNMALAVRQGTERKLDRGEKIEVEVTATVYVKPETWKDALGRVESHNRKQKTTAGSTR